MGNDILWMQQPELEGLSSLPTLIPESETETEDSNTVQKLI